VRSWAFGLAFGSVGAGRVPLAHSALATFQAPLRVYPRASHKKYTALVSTRKQRKQNVLAAFSAGFTRIHAPAVFEHFS